MKNKKLSKCCLEAKETIEDARHVIKMGFVEYVPGGLLDAQVTNAAEHLEMCRAGRRPRHVK